MTLTSLPKIGFDYDEPIHPWYDYAHQACVDAGLVPADHPVPTEWDPTPHYGCTLEEWVAVLDNEVMKGDAGIYAKPLKPGVVHYIKRLYKAGYPIHIITARGSFGVLGEKVKELTRRQVLLEKIPHDGLHFTKDKGPKIRELGLDYFIDDSPHHWIAAEEAGAKAYLLDAPWNQDFDIDPRRRVKSVKQYVNIIIDYHGWKNELSPRQQLAVSPGHPY